MTLTLELSPVEESRLRAAASAAGLTPEDYAKQNLFGAGIIGAPPADRTAELFALWDAEDAADGPGEIVRRSAEWDALKSGLNANRAACGEEPLF